MSSVLQVETCLTAVEEMTARQRAAIMARDPVGLKAVNDSLSRLLADLADEGMRGGEGARARGRDSAGSHPLALSPSHPLLSRLRQVREEMQLNAALVNNELAILGHLAGLALQSGGCYEPTSPSASDIPGGPTPEARVHTSLGTRFTGVG